MEAICSQRLHPDTPANKSLAPQGGGKTASSALFACLCSRQVSARGNLFCTWKRNKDPNSNLFFFVCHFYLQVVNLQPLLETYWSSQRPHAARLLINADHQRLIDGRRHAAARKVNAAHPRCLIAEWEERQLRQRKNTNRNVQQGREAGAAAVA